jgi:uncharacterized protein (DUF924 family)
LNSDLLILLLDQFPHNSFRGMARMYATDGLARKTADAAVRLGLTKPWRLGCGCFSISPLPTPSGWPIKTAA